VGRHAAGVKPGGPLVRVKGLAAAAKGPERAAPVSVQLRVFWVKPYCRAILCKGVLVEALVVEAAPAPRVLLDLAPLLLVQPYLD